MDRQRMLRMAGVAGIGPIALAGVIGSGFFIAQAQQDSPAGGNGAVQAQQSTTSPMDEYIAKLAANLGISEQKLRDALKTTSLQEIDAAVAAGKLTQAQADKIKEAINSGQIMGGFRAPGGPGMGDHRGGKGGGVMIRDADIAAFLGITTDQLRTEQAGKSLAQVAEAHGKTRDQLKAFLQQEHDKSVDAAVAAGKMTADQGAKAKAGFATMVERMIDGVMPNKPMGGRGPMGGPGPMSPGTMPGATQRGVN
ncbi:MAG: hypothetical protein IT302_02220 [Dehalococcoidia bacterium]|nr:hypothetical protein [Dehalococcoidia bacterium]